MNDCYRIIFLNQKIGTIFYELAYDLSRVWSPSLILSELSDNLKSDNKLVVSNAPRYNKRSYFTRVISWIFYFFYVFVRVIFTSPKSLIFTVTNPPFLGLIGYILKKTRGQKYVILVYDMHPDLLVNIGALKDGFVANIWRKVNHLVWSNADAVITIGEYMAENLAKQFDAKKTTLGEIAVVHNWADVEWLKPIAKQDNPFVKQYGLENKFVVMYSGNIGATHDLETLVNAIKTLKYNDSIKFVIIGEGAKKQFVVDSQKKYVLDNLLILPFLPHEELPFSLSSADVAIVSTGKGVDGYLVPSKFYSCLAAGNAVITICSSKCEIADIVRENRCGTVVAPGQGEALESAILKYFNHKSLLYQSKVNSRAIAVEKYSRKNTQAYIEILQKIFPVNK